MCLQYLQYEYDQYEQYMLIKVLFILPDFYIYDSHIRPDVVQNNLDSCMLNKNARYFFCYLEKMSENEKNVDFYAEFERKILDLHTFRDSFFILNANKTVEDRDAILFEKVDQLEFELNNVEGLVS